MDIADNNVWLNYNHTKDYFLLIEKMKIQLIYGLGWGIKANFPQVGPGPSGKCPACESF